MSEQVDKLLKNKGDQSLKIKEAEEFIECSECKVTNHGIGSLQIDGEEQVHTQIIIINQKEAYCLPCLESRLQEQLADVRSFEERFIYFKEFQSSYDEKSIGTRMRMEEGYQHNQQAQLAQIQTLKSEQEKIDNQLKKMKEQSSIMKEKILVMQLQEQKFWEAINKIQKRSFKLQQKSLNSKFDKNEEKDIMESLGKMSVLHLFADIKIEDNLGYVQGLAMGKKGQNLQIVWDDIAIGLGHILLLLNILAMKYSYEYKKIESMQLKGNQTELFLRLKKKPYGLLYLRENQKHFGQLLEALLFELFFISQHILESQNIEYSEQSKLPFAINIQLCKIADLYIDPTKIDERNKWVVWTKAMRYFLVDFYHLISIYTIGDKLL